VSGLGKRALVLSISRVANYGLMIISPVILVRLLSVEDFGAYREFLLYATLAQSFAAFSINDSLLYLIPRHPGRTWTIVRQTVVLTLISSLAVVVLMCVTDWLMSGGLVGRFRWPIALYVLFFVNLDFWEGYWLANHRPGPVFGYTIGRLLVRMLVVVGMAASTRNVDAIIAALIAMEGLRLVLSAVIWRRMAIAEPAESGAALRREQLRFCVPAGLAVAFSMINRNLGNLAVAKVLGAASLAQYTIGAFGEPVVVAIRNSLSTVLLPEMVRRNSAGDVDRLLLWKQTTVVNCILLFPVAVVVCCFCEPLITRVFGASYRAAVPVMQLYSLVMVRECFDFSPALRALNHTRPLMQSNLLAGLLSGVALYLLMPRWGLSGAMAARIVASVFDMLFLGYSVKRLYSIGAAQMLPWRSVGATALAALVAGGVLLLPDWTGRLGFAGVFAGAVLYGLLFVALLIALKVPEFSAVLRRLPGRHGRFASVRR